MPPLRRPSGSAIQAERSRSGTGRNVQPYARAASRYRTAGWEGVLPLPAGQKSPPPSGYTGNGGCFPTSDDIGQWVVVVKHPDGNVALRVPDGVIGIDVDHYEDKTGGDSLAQLEKAFGPLPATWISTARDLPSGIRFFRVPTGTRLNDKPGPSIEIIQHHHRYACVWPSTNPRAGAAPYRWITPDGTPVSWVPRPDELSELPPAWVDALGAPSTTGTAARGAKSVVPDFGRSQAVEIALSKALKELPGGRHDAATVGSMRLAALAHRGHAGAADALADLEAVFKRQVTEDGTRTSDEVEQEWERMVTGAEQKVAADEATAEQYDDPPPGLFRRYTAAELLGLPENVSWTIKGLLADPTYGQVAGEMKTLKT